MISGAFDHSGRPATRCHPVLDSPNADRLAWDDSSPVGVTRPSLGYTSSLLESQRVRARAKRSPDPGAALDCYTEGLAMAMDRVLACWEVGGRFEGTSVGLAEAKRRAIRTGCPSNIHRAHPMALPCDRPATCLTVCRSHRRCNQPRGGRGLPFRRSGQRDQPAHSPHTRAG
jgi:hypothetical protein